MGIRHLERIKNKLKETPNPVSASFFTHHWRINYPSVKEALEYLEKIGEVVNIDDAGERRGKKYLHIDYKDKFLAELEKQEAVKERTK